MSDDPTPGRPDPAPAAADPPPPTAPPAASPRRRNLKILAGVVAVCVVGYAGYWYWNARFFESTDDCYVNGDVVQVTTEIPGTVIQLHADDTQSVARGQALRNWTRLTPRWRRATPRPIWAAP